MAEQKIEGNLETVSERLREFLTRKKSENIVLSGAWGTGKTETWKRAVREQNAPCLSQGWKALFTREKYLARPNYAYISVTGCKDLKALEEKILDATQPCWQAGKDVSFWDLFIREILKPCGWAFAILVILILVSFGGWYLYQNFVQILFTPFLVLYTFFVSDVLSYFSKADPRYIVPCTTIFIAVFTALYVFFKTNRKALVFRDAIICLDDIERASKDLDPQDILNFAADLRDNKNCKVVMILNPKQFDKNNQESDTVSKEENWQRALEKGSNAHLVLKLDAEDAAELALGKPEETDKDTLIKNLREQVIKLKINNVRIIQRIRDDAERWRKLVKEVAKEEDVSQTDLYAHLTKYFSVFGMYFYEFDKRNFSDVKNISSIPNGERLIMLYSVSLENSWDNSSQQWLPLAGDILKAIETGGFPSSLSKEHLQGYALQLTSTKMKALVDEPLRLAKEVRKPKEEIKKALEEIPLELKKVTQIGLIDAHWLLFFANEVGENPWKADFRMLYFRSLERRDADFFRTGFPYLPEGIKEDLKIKKEFERLSQAKKKPKEGEEPYPVLDRMLSMLPYQPLDMMDNDEYLEWNEIILREKLKKFSVQNILNIADNFCCNIVPVFSLHPGFSEIPACFSYQKEGIFQPEWPGFRAFQKLGILLYPILKEYWESQEIMHPALGYVLKTYPWQELIDFEFPEKSE